jgi:glycerophosphoryl diester phosphodiesterase
VTLIYGHRGAKGEAPENTLTSFQECLKHGVRRCELDLHLSMDGELMVIHDPTLGLDQAVPDSDPGRAVREMRLRALAAGGQERFTHPRCHDGAGDS